MAPRPNRRSTLEPLKVGLSRAQAARWPHTDPLDVYNGVRAVLDREKGWHTSPRDFDSTETERRLMGRHFRGRVAVRTWLLEEEPRMGPLADYDLVFVLRRRERLPYIERQKRATWVDREGNVVHPTNSQLRRHRTKAHPLTLAEMGWHMVNAGPDTGTFYQVGIYNAS
jgi:hypothetical protein